MPVEVVRTIDAKRADPARLAVHRMRPASGAWALAASVALVLLASACAGASHPTPGSASATGSAAQDRASADPRPSPGCNGSPGATPLVAGRRTIVVGGTARNYQLALPRLAPGRAAGLMFEFHGFDGSGAQLAALTELDRKGTANGYIVVSPDGTNATWQFDAHGTDADFIDALVAEITNATCVDLDRVYATGFSAGAAFTIVYSCARQGLIAAIATVAVDFQLGCTAPMPILAFHGTADPLVPFTNGAEGLSLPGVKVRGTELNMADWAHLDGCRPVPDETTIGSEVTRQTWPSCTRDTQVILYRIEGGGHTWPGADPSKGVGLTTQQVVATDQILTFFGHHHLV
jgi:polyhydroxybutyrate depolymerase